MKIKFNKFKDYLKKINYYKIIKHLTIGIDVLFVFMLLFNYLNYLPEFWNMTYIFFFVVAVNAIFLAFKINKIPENKRKDSKMIYYFSHFFLLSLVLIVLNQFLKRQFIIDFLPEISALAIGLGFLTFYAYRNKVEKEIEDEKVSEEKAEKKRFDEFGKRFPFWDRIPVLRRFVRWMYKEGWWYSVGLILLIVVFSAIYIYNLGRQYMWTDEVYSFTAAKMILQKGVPIFDTGLKYFGSLFYHYILSVSMYFFGVNEFGGRIINVLFTIGTSLLIYMFFRDKSKLLGLIGIFLFLTTNLTLAMVRETRMYSMLTFLFLFSVYCFYNALINKRKLNHKVKIFSIGIDFNLWWLILFCITFYLSFQTHPLSSIFVFGLLIYYFLLNIKFGIKKKYLLPILFLVIISFIGTFYQFKTINIIEAFSEQTTLNWAVNNKINPPYYLNLLKMNVPFYYVSFCLAIALLLFIRDKKFLLITSILFICIYVISYQRQLQERYLYFLIPLIILVIIYGIYFLTRMFIKDSYLKYLVIFIFLLLLISHLGLFFKEVNEINKYTENSISKHKKYEFEKVINYINNLNLKNELLIADSHATPTLFNEGLDVNYMLITKQDYRSSEKIDPYFNMPYLIYGSQEYNQILSYNKVIIVFRDPKNFDLKNEPIHIINISIIPKVYSN